MRIRDAWPGRRWALVLLAAGLVLAAWTVTASRPARGAVHQEPIAWWSFDEPAASTVLDRAGQVTDTIKGHSYRRAGVSGRGLKFDDHTTQVVRGAARGREDST